MFGETSAVMGCRSSFTAQCKNYCTIAALADNDYLNLASLFPSVEPRMTVLMEQQSIDPIA